MREVKGVQLVVWSGAREISTSGICGRIAKLRKRTGSRDSKRAMKSSKRHDSMNDCQPIELITLHCGAYYPPSNR